MRKGLAKRKADRKKSFMIFVIICTFIIMLFLYLVIQDRLYRICYNDEHIGECCKIENYNPENNIEERNDNNNDKTRRVS